MTVHHPVPRGGAMTDDTEPDRPSVLRPPPGLGVGIELLGLAYDVHHYHRHHDLPPRMYPVGWDDWSFELLREDGVELVLGVDFSGDLWMVTPGTNGWGDWLRNLDPLGVRIPGAQGWYRRGFARHGEIAWKLAGKRILEHPGGVCMVSHSLGGAAQASILARLAIARRPDMLRSAITLAAPPCVCPVAETWLEQIYGNRLGAWEHAADIVPHAVPSIAGWRVPGELRVIGRDGTIRRRADWGRELWRALRIPGLQIVEDHGVRAWRAWATTLAA